MSFLSAGALWGLGLISVPIVLHLLNKRKFRVVDWAPMEYLKLSIKESRRKVRLEELLLLFLRCAIVAMVIFTLARPMVSRSGALSLFAAGSRTSHLVVLDDSLSMQHTQGQLSAFERGQDAVTALLGAFGGGDEVTVVLATDPVSTLAAPLEEGGSVDRVATASCSDAGAQWDQVFEAATDWGERALHPSKVMWLVTDLRRSGWDDGVLEVSANAAAAGLTLKVIDVGSMEESNLALLSLASPDRAVVRDVQTSLTATLWNGTGAPVGPLTATLLVGDLERAVTVPRVEPEAVLELPIPITFTEAGVHAVSLRLPQDALPADDLRTVAIDVRSSLRVLLVDGDPSAEAFESETDFLAAAMLSGGGLFDAYSLTDSEWLSAAPEAFDLLVLANVASIGAGHGKRLEELVSAGMGLMVFPGDQLDPESYAADLFKGGNGLIPASVERVSDETRTGLLVEDQTGSPLARLTDLVPGALGNVRVRQSLDLGISEAAQEATRVLARYDDGDKSPALLERRFGHGRVLQWTTTADRDWSDWPTEPTFLLCVCEAARGAADRGTRGLNHRLGTPVVLETRGASVREPSLLDEDGTPVGRLLVRGDEVAFEGLRHAGTYRARYVSEAGEEVVRSLAVQGPEQESRLARLPAERCLALTAPLAPRLVPHASLDELLEPEGEELWRTLAFLALAFLAVESVFMVWVGRRG